MKDWRDPGCYPSNSYRKRCRESLPRNRYGNSHIAVGRATERCRQGRRHGSRAGLLLVSRQHIRSKGNPPSHALIVIFRRLIVIHAAARQNAIMILGILGSQMLEFIEVRHALGTVRFTLASQKHRISNTGQRCQNRNDDQKFDQGKSSGRFSGRKGNIHILE